MKRRQFIKGISIGTVIATNLPLQAKTVDGNDGGIANRDKDKWFDVATGKFIKPERKKSRNYNVVVIGGGLAGICAAVAAARKGSRTILVQDRPVLGGNSSSEIRVWIHGAQFRNMVPERETGLIEEILLLNRFLNPQESWSMWDHVLYEFVTREPNLTLMLNTSALKAQMNGDKIDSALCWQATTETLFELKGKIFIDCSGDGLLAASAGALYRTGREAKAEFNESYAPEKADGWQMGSTIVFTVKDLGYPVPYTLPSFAIKYEAEKSHPGRAIQLTKNGQFFWWIEVGSNGDIISEQENIRHKLLGYIHGVWDYIKNSGKFPEAETLALDWVGAIPGKRESRRFIGDYILSERDLTEHRHFEDAVAFGGWALDEHNPGGIENLKEPPSYFHRFFDRVYEIPFRCLYSKNIPNLFFAGRNISQTHIALSSTRVMATCALMGQAVGTAAALCLKKNILPRALREKHIGELQEQLLRDDVFIPNRPARDENDLARKANLIFASSTTSGDAKLLVDGWSRDIDSEIHHWQSDGLPAEIQLEWEKTVPISCVEIKCDTNLKRHIMMRNDHRNDELYCNTVPPELVKSLEIQARINGEWKKIASLNNNQTRLIRFNFKKIKTNALLVKIKETYGSKNAKLFEIRCYSS